MRMRLPGMREAPAKRGVDTLRSIIALSKTGEVLHQIPDRLANVISRFDSVPLSPEFRTDVYNILSTSLDLAEALLDATYPVEHASGQIAQQMQTLARVLNHLNHRPYCLGYSILIPSTGKLLGQFNTAGEGEHHLDGLRALGAVGDAMVVPVRITSQHAVQPRAVPPPISDPNPILDGPLPQGITPAKPNPQPSVAARVEEAVAGLRSTDAWKEIERENAKKASIASIPLVESVKDRMVKLEKEAAELARPRGEDKA